MKSKVIIVYNRLFHYRIPIWNILSQYCDLTVAYSFGDKPKDIECNFETLYLPVRKMSKFVIHKCNIKKLCSEYDVVIGYGDIAWLKLSLLPLMSKQKVVFHTLGVSASYDKGFDEHKEWDKIRCWFYKKASAIVFYTSYPIDKYYKMGISKEKMFVAPNTVAVIPTQNNVKKDSILMIGTLYKAKGLQALLDVYLCLKNECKLPILNIIGDGPDYEMVRQWIVENQMEDKVKLRGAIYDIEEKANYFSRAYAVISPKQAGLTVQESMGYGVPFITTKNAITGGEVLSIHNGIDGVLMDSVDELPVILKDISENPEKYIEMGVRAKEFYNGNLTPEIMAKGLWNAVQYALNS